MKTYLKIESVLICRLVIITQMFLFSVSTLAQSEDETTGKTLNEVHMRKYNRDRQKGLVEPVEALPDERCTIEFLTTFLDQQECLRGGSYENCKPLIAGLATTGTGAGLGYLIAKKMGSPEAKIDLAEYHAARKKVRELGFAIFEVERQKTRALIESGKKHLLSIGVDPKNYLLRLSNESLRDLPTHTITQQVYDDLPESEKLKYGKGRDMQLLHDEIRKTQPSFEREFLKTSTNLTVQNLIKSDAPAANSVWGHELEQKLWVKMMDQLKKWVLTPTEKSQLDKLVSEAKAKLQKETGDSTEPRKLMQRVSEIAKETNPRLYQKLSVAGAASPTFLRPEVYLAPSRKATRQGLSPTMGGLLGVQAGYLADVGLKTAGKSNIDRCSHTLQLSNEEIKILRSFSVNLTFENCKNIRISNPREAIEQSYAEFGFVPKGMCRLILREDQTDKKFLQLQNLKIDSQNCDQISSGDFKIESQSSGNKLVCNDTKSRVTYQVPLRSNLEVDSVLPGGTVKTKALTLDGTGQPREVADFAKAFEGQFVGGVKINPNGLSSDLTNIRLRTDSEIYQSVTSTIYEREKGPENFVDRCYSAYVGLRTLAASQKLSGQCAYKTDVTGSSTSVQPLPKDVNGTR